MLRIKQRKLIWFCIIVLGVILLGTPAIYAGDTEPSPADVAYQKAVQDRIDALDEIASNREAVIDELVSQWFMDEDGWEQEFRSALNKANDSKLLAVREADSYEKVQTILLGGYNPDNLVLPNALGETDRDLVYTPVQPCRIIDTRNAGGKIGTNSFRSFHVYGSNMSSQGGNPAGCPSWRGEPVAVHMNIAAVNSTGGGYLTVWPYNTTMPNSAVLNYSPTDKTDPVSNTFTVKTKLLGGYEISVYAYRETHVVADVMGYYFAVDPADYKVKFAGSQSSSTTSLYTGGGCTNYTGGQVSIYAPGPGKITVNAQAWLNLYTHTYGTSDSVGVYIGTSATDCTFSNSSQGYNSMYWQVPSGHATWASGPQAQTIPVSRTFTVTSAGTKTYYLNGLRNSGGGTMYFWYAGMQATFYPDF